jgi:hypothetical protein
VRLFAGGRHRDPCPRPVRQQGEVKERIAEIEGAAGDRAGRIEYNMNVLVVGDSIPPGLVPLVGDDLSALIEADSVLMLRGTPRQMADEIERRRDAFGFSYITVNAMYVEEFAPVVDLLDGR